MIEAGRNAEDAIIRDYAEFAAVTQYRRVRLQRQEKAVFLKRALAPCDTVQVELLAKAAANGMDAIRDYLLTTAYGARLHCNLAPNSHCLPGGLNVSAVMFQDPLRSLWHRRHHGGIIPLLGWLQWLVLVLVVFGLIRLSRKAASSRASTSPWVAAILRLFLGGGAF